tara:strand:- start:5258 stop:6712 length:1455 start_codon:yes stop_codon:yes gene_type:complete
MALSQGVQQKQTGSLTLTPQLRQAIKLLELSNLELTDYLSQEMLDNPLLDLAPGETSPSDDSDHTHTDQESHSSTSELDNIGSEEYNNVWSNESEADRWQNSSSSGGHFDDGSSTIENRLVATSLSLREHLLSQLHTDFSNPVDLIIGEHLIEGLDESGYLCVPLSNISEKLGCPENRVLETLLALQKCDPAGVFAQNLIDCLKLQLIDQECLTPDLEKLLDHLDLFAHGKIDQLQKVTSLTRDKLSKNLHIIQSLNPRPGLLFEPTSREEFQPDVFVRWQDGQKNWVIHLNEATLPKVLIDTGYYARVCEDGEKEVKAYLKERFKSANWLIKALDQRAQTILKVSSEIVKQQGDFLKKGLSHLKPMTLKDIAVAVDLHESTVSRVTQHKYMMTPRGTFDMKIFFSSAVASMTNESTYSSSSVQHLIQELIESEAPQAPYSDDQLVQALAEKGVDVARRTISKYRKIMNIASSYERKKKYLRQI